MDPEKRAHLKEQVAKRAELQKLDELLAKRRDFVTAEKARLAKEGKGDGFDKKVNEIISKRHWVTHFLSLRGGPSPPPGHPRSGSNFPRAEPVVSVPDVR